jgi:hypothetical protein
MSLTNITDFMASGERGSGQPSCLSHSYSALELESLFVLKTKENVNGI